MDNLIVSKKEVWKLCLQDVEYEYETMNELLPCLCSFYTRTVLKSNYEDGYWVECSNCQTKVTGGGDGDAAIKAWNSRVDTNAELARLQRILADSGINYA